MLLASMPLGLEVSSGSEGANLKSKGRDSWWCCSSRTIKLLLVFWVLLGLLLWYLFCLSQLQGLGFPTVRRLLRQWWSSSGQNQSPALPVLFSALYQDLYNIWQYNYLLYVGGEDSTKPFSLKITWWIIVGTMLLHRASIISSNLQDHPRQQESQQKKWQSQRLQVSRCGGRWRKRLLFLGVMAGVFISIWIFRSMNANIISRRKETLASMCDERARMLQDQFNVSMNHVHALAILISTFHHGKQPSAITQRTFAEYTARTAFERPLTSGVAYALKVLHPQREQFEKLQGWKIKKMKKVDHSPVQDEYKPEDLDPAPVQDEYAPVIFSQETVAHIVSIDMMSGKEDRENILRARASGKGALTSPFKLLKSNHLGVVLTFAVYKTDLPPDATSEERIEYSEGYLGASFDVETLVEKLLQQLASKQTIVVNVYDTSNSSGHIKMYGPDASDTGLLHVSHLEFGDPYRRHEMHCRFKHKPPMPWSAITTSVGVGVIVLLLGHIFYAAISRIEKVEDDYQKMRELKVRAEAADVAKSQFLATVSHEIRTPMNGVLGMLQMLMHTDLDATQKDFAMTAQDSGKALINLINEVLDQAKIESGRLELETVPFDVRAVLDNVLSLFSDKSQEKSIELAVHVSNDVPEVIIGDPGRFRQIITNLVGNSMKFTEKGHVFVSLHLAERVIGMGNDRLSQINTDFVREEATMPCNTLSGHPVVNRWKIWEQFTKEYTSRKVSDSISLLVAVEDTGVGIPSDAQSRIFKPFMQADSSTSRTYGGTGIGLSISKCLVDLMGGEIGFVSQPGVGSTFGFTAVFREGQKALVDTKRQQTETTIPHLKGMRGLVIDGSAIRAEVTKYHLERLGLHVDIAIKPKSLLSCICDASNSRTNRCLDMVFIDKEYWGTVTGVAFSAFVRDLSMRSLEHLPKVFLLVTSLSPSEVEDLKSSGYLDNVLLKPLRPSKMMTSFRKTLGVDTKRHQDKGPPLRSLLNGKKILVVDDNMVNRRVAAGVLAKYGAKVTCVESGKIAVEMLRPPHQFDACFMDVQMPEMDGFQATKKVREIEKTARTDFKVDEKSMKTTLSFWHVPILAMTADVFQATHEECIKCGMDGYVSKPFEEEQLYSAVAHFFESHSEEET